MNQKTTYISKETCNMMRGIAALVIILHHTVNYISLGPILDFFLKNIGASMTTIFFFYSGYGLMLSRNKKEDYMKQFLKKRIPSIVIPYLIVNIVYIVGSALLGMPVAVLERCKELAQGRTIVPFSWYVIVILILYLCFYLSFRWLQPKQGLCLCILLNIGYIVTAYLIGFDEYWYNTAFAFSFGLLYAYAFDRVDPLVRKHPILGAVISVGIFFVLFVMGRILNGSSLVVLIKSLRSAAFCMFALYASMLLVKQFRLLHWLGDRSFELYLYQGVAFMVLNFLGMQQHAIVYAIGELVFTGILAFVFQKVNTWLLKPCLRSK